MTTETKRRGRPPVPPERWKHGTRSTYDKRACRCAPCSAAKAAYAAQRADKNHPTRVRRATKPQSAARKALIAAAPDLLAACEATLDLLVRSFDAAARQGLAERTGPVDTLPAVIALRAAIKKARGEK